MPKVLYLHHCATYGGASRSLFEAIGIMRDQGVEPLLLTPKGTTANKAQELGFETHEVLGFIQFDNTTFGHYRGKRWLVLLREIFLIIPTIWTLLQIRYRHGDQIDLVHVNDYNLVFTGVLAKWILQKPVLIHVRAGQQVENRWRHKFLAKLANRYFGHVVCISAFSYERVGRVQAKSIIFNGQKPPTVPWSPTQQKPGSPFTIGIVANFIPYKGLREFVEAARICVNEYGLDNMRFEVVGNNHRKSTGPVGWILKQTGFIQDLETETLDLVARENLQDYLVFRGFVDGVEKIFPHLDVLAFPSHLDAPGRPVFEAAFFGVPSVVALRSRTTDDGIVHEETGLVIPEKDPNSLALAFRRMYENRQTTREMGQRAQALAYERFNIEKNAIKLLAIYHSLLNMHPPDNSTSENDNA